MKFIIQYSDKAKLISKTLNKFDEETMNKFKFLLLLQANEMKIGNVTYKVQK